MRLPLQPDSLAERGGFEPSRPFISRVLPRFTRISFLQRVSRAKRGSPKVVRPVCESSY